MVSEVCSCSFSPFSISAESGRFNSLLSRPVVGPTGWVRMIAHGASISLCVSPFVSLSAYLYLCFRSIVCDGMLSPKDDFFPPCLVVE